MQDSEDSKDKNKDRDWVKGWLCVLFIWALTAFACHYTVSTYKLLTAVEKPDPTMTRVVEIGEYKCIDLPKRIKCFPAEE